MNAPRETLRVRLRAAMDAGIDGIRNKIDPGAAADKDRVAIPPTRFNVPVSPHKAFGACFAPLDQLRAVREQVRAAITHPEQGVAAAGASALFLGLLQ